MTAKPNLFLIGYRGTGKSTVAALLSEQLGWTWVDADDEIERSAGRSIAQIFETDGEQAFRDLESTVVSRLASREQSIISLGGGAVVREGNRRAMAGRGSVAWLRASPETIFGRTQTDDTTALRRPNLTAGGGLLEVQKMLAQRTPIYRQCADFAVDTEGKTPQRVADEILSRFDRKAT